MVGNIDLGTLRELLRGVTRIISDRNTHPELAAARERLGLPTPPEDNGSKHERVIASLAALPDAQLPEVARRVIKELPIDAKTRNAIQDVLWVGENPPPIQKRTRREIARSLSLTDLIHSADRFLALLDSLWILDDLFTFGEWMGAGGAGLRRRIERHVFANDDWSTEELLENLGAFEATDRRFALFLEGLASADVVLDEPAQHRIVEAINPHLRAIGLELRAFGDDDGYPVFRIVSTHTKHNRRPKNLIFASRTKPDIRLPNAVDNDIEIVGDADAVLVYDLPIGAEGIRWRDLQAWWKDTRQIHGDEKAKSSLYGRLKSILPVGDFSSPQLNLYELYHEIHAPAVPDLPALLPEVWLHWDPKTIRMRGQDALLRLRMDFLLLLPRGQRVVLEVDGQHHYATNGRPDPAAYASNMRADRDLKLSGYEVFRFSANELEDKEHAREMVQRFFQDLFTLFSVPVP